MRTRTSAFEARHLPPGRGEIRDVKYNDQVDTRLGREERNLSEVGEPHEVAVGVDEEGGGEVTGADEQQGGIHPEDCCVRELKMSNKCAQLRILYRTSPKIGPSRCARFVFVILCNTL